MSDRDDKLGDKLGDAISLAIDQGANAAGRELWRKIGGVFAAFSQERIIEVTETPTVAEAYMPDGGWCYARTIAWQIDSSTRVPVALWMKATDASLDWEKIWPITVSGWEHVTVNPSSAGLARGVFTIVWQDYGSPIRPVAIWVKYNTGSRNWSKIWPVDMPAADDHLVKARNVDATTVGGLLEKTGPSPTVTPELYTDPVIGVERVRFNTVPAVPNTGGSWLYTGSIQAATLLDPVESFVSALAGWSPGGGQADLWDVLENGDYRHKAVGQLYGLDPTGTQAFVLSQGDRVYLWNWQVTGALGPGGDLTVYGGLCTVITLGDGSTKAVLRKTSDTIVDGSTFLVEGDGAQYEGWYWEIDPDPTKLYPLTYKPDYQNETTYNLLTSSQVSRAGMVTRETSVTIPGNTSGGTMFAIPYFEMLDGLGVTTLPKGVVNWEILAYVVSDDPTATIFIRSFLTTDQGVLQRFGYADTPAMHNTTAAVLRCQGTISADRTVSPTDKLGAVFYGYSSSASSVTIKLVYNDAGHQTRVQTPLVTAGGGGTFDHRLLTATSRGFEAGDEVKAAAYAHPATAVSTDTSQFTGRLTSADTDVQKALVTLGAQARWQSPRGATVATVDGYLTMPAGSNSARISGTEELLGIATANWQSGSVIFVEFANARSVQNGGSSPTGYAVPDFGSAFGWATAPGTLNAPVDGVMILQLSGSSEWRVLSAPWAGLAPGWVHTPFGDTITIGGAGTFSIPGPYQHANSVKVSGAVLNGIDASYLEYGDRVQVRFVTNCRVYGGQTVSSPAMPFVFPVAGGLTGSDLDIVTGPGGSAEFQIDSDGWHLVSPPYITDQTP